MSSNILDLKKSYETNKINSILNDFEISTEARAFLNENLFNVFVAVLVDQSVKSKIAFELPYKLKSRIGVERYNVDYISNHRDEVICKFKEKPALHRYPERMATFVCELAAYLLEKYDGDIKMFLLANDDLKKFEKRLCLIKGISIKKANLMALILELDYGVKFKNTAASHALMDRHIIDYLKSIGVDNPTQADGDLFFSKIDPSNPALASATFWKLEVAQH